MTMKNNNHIAEEWIVAYAAGTLSEGKEVLVASHLSFHPELQKTAKDAEAIGGALLAEEEGIDMSNDALNQTLKKIGSVTLESEEAHTSYDCPKPLGDYMNKNLKDLKWRLMGPGMRQAKLWSGEDGEHLWLLKAKGGTHIPAHDHTGQEMTLILQGSYHVGDTRFSAGDIEIADQETRNHRPMIDEGDDCICLVVTDAPLRMHGFLARLAQPFIGL